MSAGVKPTKSKRRSTVMTKANVSEPAGRFNPQGAVVNAYRYFDKVGTLVEGAANQEHPHSTGAGIRPGGLHVVNGPAWFDPRYRQSIESTNQ